MIVALNMLVYGELDWELDFAFCACSRSFPGIVTRKSKETILLLLLPQSERNKQRDGECKKHLRLCNKHAHHKRNVDSHSFILLFVHHLSRIPEFVVVVGSEEVNWKWLYYH